MCRLVKRVRESERIISSLIAIGRGVEDEKRVHAPTLVGPALHQLRQIKQAALPQLCFRRPFTTAAMAAMPLSTPVRGNHGMRSSPKNSPVGVNSAARANAPTW